jgi:hypothetical protein
MTSENEARDHGRRAAGGLVVHSGRPSAVLQLVEQGDLLLVPQAAEIANLQALLDRCADVRMDLGDA